MLETPDIKLVHGYPMPRSQRLMLLHQWSERKRKGESDVIARIALDEIEELKLQIASLERELDRAKSAGFRG